jgi:hypothetical protein
MRPVETESRSSARAGELVGGDAVLGARIAQAVSDVLVFIVASALAGICAYAIWSQLPEELDVRTDIVGYPIHSNFNINRYVWFYWLIAGFVPVVTLAIFLAIRKVIPRGQARRRPRPRQPAVEESPPPLSGRTLVAVGIARVAFVGGVFGLEIAFAMSEGSGWVLSIGLPVMAGYASLAYVAALVVERVVRFPTTFWERLALVNAFAVPFCVAALYGVSRSTEISVASSGRVHEYAWFPGWLAAGLTVGLLAWTLWSAFLAWGGIDFHKLERRLLLVVAGPVVIFLFVAALPGAGGGIDFFHEGEFLAGERLTEDGAFPWRDLIFIHGFLSDVLFPSVGFTLFEDSRWGHVAGISVVVVPLYWISMYYLFAYLFHRNWFFLIGTQLALVLGVVVEVHLRFLLLPFMLLLLAALLSRPSWARALAFMGVVIVETIIVPETAVAAVAVLVTIVAFEAYYYDRSKAFLPNFRRTFLCTGAGMVLTTIWVAFLAAYGALDDFVFSYLTFASDHTLTGGLPVAWVDDRFRFAVGAPVVLVVLAFWYFAFQIVRRGSPSVADWTMGASALFVALYYHRFLSRADEHVYNSYAVAIPLLYYALYRLISLAEESLRRIGARLDARALIRLGVTAVAVGALLVQAPASVADVVGDAPRRLDASVDEEPRTPAIGFTARGRFYDDLLEDVDTILSAYIGPDGEVFDFGNSPALFHYFLDRPSPTRYYHVSMAIRGDTQEDLVDELERERPRLVVFSSHGTGLPVWDFISNQVRHYRVSEYLLDHYRPFMHWNGFTFMWRKGVELRPARLANRLEGLTTEDLYFRTYECDWGYAPSFLSDGPSTSPAPLRLTAREHGQFLSVGGWAVDRTAKVPVAKVLAAVDGKVVAEVTPSAPRPDIAGHLKNDAYIDSGFAFGAPVPRAGPREVRIYGLSHSGKAAELDYTGASPWGLGRGRGPRALLLNGRRVPVEPGAASGFVDSSSLSEKLVALDLPTGVRLDQYDWLEIETGSQLGDNRFTLTDRPTDLRRNITFRMLDHHESTVRVLVGACSQWHGYRARRLYLRIDRRQAIAAVRLYR